jgi:NAD(P)-dependent dehydrogenase (short-subunit alcohol dehydrogenase family)
MTEAQVAPKVALITGATRGIGFEIARQLAQMGITVILTGRTLVDAEHAANKINAGEMVALPLRLDVTKPSEIDEAVRFVTEKFGRLDILINNAGTLQDYKELPTREQMRDTFEVNTIGPYFLTQAMLPLLKKSKAGRIVNQSSIMGSIANAATRKGGAPAYGASKAALNMLTVLLSRQLQDTNIKVNACHPGWVRTAMGGEEAPLLPTEGAKTAIRLALLPDNGPTGGFFHGEERLEW